MWVKKFLARTLPEAMAQVKAELGSEAVILHTNQVKVGGLFGLFGTRMIEVTAAADTSDRWRPNAPPDAAPTAEQLFRALQPSTVHTEPQKAVATATNERRGTELAAGGQLVTQVIDEEAGRTPDDLADVRSDVVSMKALLHQVLDSLATTEEELTPDLKAIYTSLRNGGVQDEIALNLIGRIRNTCAGRGAGAVDAMQIARELMQTDLGKTHTLELPVSNRRIVALIGPTGVGKTTTLAKLAAHYALGRRLRVGLITSDTFRVAAVDQLRTYSEILGVPLEVVYDPSEIVSAVERQLHRDLILVDTAGRSPRNDLHMKELRQYLDALRPDEVYLVMSMTSSYRDALRIVESYLPMGFDRFIFTKWDEGAEPGLIYNIVCKYKLALSYITTGQNVPDDIEMANPETIIRAILGD